MTFKHSVAYPSESKIIYIIATISRNLYHAERPKRLSTPLKTDKIRLEPIKSSHIAIGSNQNIQDMNASRGY